MINNDIRSNTKKTYTSRINAFSDYCADIGCSPRSAPVEVITNFLALLSNTLGYSYSSVAGYRSAISKFHSGIDSTSVGRAKPIVSVTRAAFLHNPPLPRYTNIWNVNQLLEYLETLSPLDELSDIDLSMKTYALFAVLSISRASSATKLEPRFQLVGEEVLIPLAGLEKNSRPGITNQMILYTIMIMILLMIMMISS